jgi:phospholipid/cholesterol/gamma-HCH transport system substrate-binding protein
MGPLMERIGRSADAVEKMGRETALASQNADVTITRVGGDLQRFTSDTLPELDRLLGELNTLSSSLRRLSDQTARSPSSLIFGQGALPLGPGESATASPRREP